MKTKFAKLSVCLGVLFISFNGCKSENNQNNNDKNFMGAVNQMMGVNDKNYVDLEGNWRFSIGDDSSWALPDFDDKNWEKIKVPATWEDQGFHGYNG